jgi:hypothetical protein
MEDTGFSGKIHKVNPMREGRSRAMNVLFFPLWLTVFS